jgi:hypothetical protein
MPTAGRSATRPYHKRIDPHATGCTVAPKLRTKTEARGVELLEVRLATTTSSNAGDKTKRFHAIEIKAAANQGPLTSRYSLENEIMLIESLKLAIIPLCRRPALLSRKPAVANPPARVAKSTATM